MTAMWLGNPLPEKRYKLKGAVKKFAYGGLTVLCLMVAMNARYPVAPLRKPDGKVFFDLSGRPLRFAIASDEQYRFWRPLSQLSEDLIQITLLREDRWFFVHPGFNPVSLVRAFFQTYLQKERRIGGSTLTMQVARLLYGIESRSPLGKLEQIARAMQLEMYYAKREILEAYLNLAPFGYNIEGVEAASLIYFSKSARDLQLEEAIPLMLIPQNPAKRALREDQEGFVRDRKRLLDAWRRKFPAKGVDMQKLSLPLQFRTPNSLPFRAPHFTDYLSQTYPERIFYETSLDLHVQSAVEGEVADYLRERRRLGIENAAVLVVDHRQMRIQAMVGSADFFAENLRGQVNGTTSRRSPGSLLKPLVYGLAMDQGLIHPMTLLKDAPTALGAYAPANFDQDFRGPVSVTDALNRSRNIPAVTVAARLGDPDLYAMLRTLGIGNLRSRDHYGLSIVLGTAELTMIELASLYGMLVNQGQYRPVRALQATGEASPGTLVFSPQAAFLILDMMYKNGRPDTGFRKELLRDASDVAWKSGTSWGFRDAWAVGISGPHLILVWIGNFDGRSDPHLIGGPMAGPLLFRIIDHLAAKEGTFHHTVFSLPKDVVEVEVCALSGAMPNSFCRHKSKTFFIAGKSPIEACTIHRRIEIDPLRRFQLCQGVERKPGSTYEIYEFWPSDLLNIFAMAGLPRMTPPPLDPHCRQEGRGTKPSILSPRLGLVYKYRSLPGIQQDLAFEASVDADAKTLYWFLNRQYLGSVPRGEKLFWQPQPGQHLVQVLDDQGRATTRSLTVEVIQ